MSKHAHSHGKTANDTLFYKCIIYSKAVLFFYSTFMLTVSYFATIVYAYLVLLGFGPQAYRKCVNRVEASWVSAMLALWTALVGGKYILSVPNDSSISAESALYALQDYFDFDQPRQGNSAKAGKRVSVQAKEAKAGAAPSLPHPFSVTNDLIIANHQTYFDWVFVWTILHQIGRAGDLRIIMKDSLRKIPIMGAAMKVFNFIFVKRDWQKDQNDFVRGVRRLAEDNLPFLLLIFPEGTTISRDSMASTFEYACRQEMPVPRHSLIPRVTGLNAIFSTLNDQISDLYDVTLGVEGLPPNEIPEEYYSTWGIFVCGKAPHAVHAHVRYFPLSEIPRTSQAEFSEWLYERFKEKDALLQKFYKKTHSFEGIQAAPISYNTRRRVVWVFVLVAFLTALYMYLFSWIFPRVYTFSHYYYVRAALW